LGSKIGSTLRLNSAPWPEVAAVTITANAGKNRMYHFMVIPPIFIKEYKIATGLVSRSHIFYRSVQPSHMAPMYQLHVRKLDAFYPSGLKKTRMVSANQSIITLSRSKAFVWTI
jgi:hypothetical protein